MKLKILSGNDVRQVLTMAEAIAAVKKAYIQISEGKAIMPPRTSIFIKKREGRTLFMPAYLTTSGAFGAKIASIFPGNHEKNLPNIHAMMIIIDEETGCPVLVMDGIYLTALRTGAASGLATDLMARTEARVVSIIGAGTQARTQLEAVCTVRSIEKVWVYDSVSERAAAYVKKMKAYGRPLPHDIFVAESPSQAIRESDIICTTTTSYKPVFNDSDLKVGVHINGIGSYTPEMQEIPSETVVRSKIIVDSRSACLTEAGDLIIPLKESLITKDHIHGEIGEIAAGEVTGRESEDEVTIFKSVGLAVQDVAVAELIRHKAEKLGLGIDVEI